MLRKHDRKPWLDNRDFGACKKGNVREKMDSEYLFTSLYQSNFDMLRFRRNPSPRDEGIIEDSTLNLVYEIDIQWVTAKQNVVYQSRSRKDGRSLRHCKEVTSDIFQTSITSNGSHNLSRPQLFS